MSYDSINSSSSLQNDHTSQIDDEELMRLYIGNNADYYLKKWGRTTAPESSFSWNWAAFFTCAFWIGYRQMYLYLAILVGVMLSADIGYIYLLAKQPDIRIPVIMSLLMGGFGNALYYRHVKRKIAQLKELDLGQEELKKRAARSGGPNWRGILATLIFLFLYSMTLGFLTSL